MEREQNIVNAKHYGKIAIEKGCVPIIAHTTIAAILDDNIEEERNAGIEADLALLSVCDEIWVFGERVSAGMKIELGEARNRRLPIRWFTTYNTNYNGCLELSDEIKEMLLKKHIIF